MSDTGALMHLVDLKVHSPLALVEVIPLFASGTLEKTLFLSYADLCSDLKLSPTKDCGVIVTFDIKNTGKRAGSTVGQIYVHQSRPSVEKPDVELAGFARLYLQPGETGSASIVLDVRTLLMSRQVG